MSTHDSQHDLPQPGPSAETNLRFIEALVGPEDAWITITDAARITRTSEAMARRWVASGRLPVKRQLAGINQQTRLVRLSDVAAIRPIIDPMAAISDEIHKLDLQSIPRQQAHIMQDHERLVQQVQRGQQALNELEVDLRETGVRYQQAIEDIHQQLLAQQEEGQRDLVRRQQQHDLLAGQVHQQGNALKQTNQHLAEQRREQQRDVEVLHTTLTEQFKRVQEEQAQKFEELDQRQHQQGERVRSDLLAIFQQQQIQTQATVKEVKETQAQLAQDCQQHRQKVTAQEEALLLQGKKLITIEERIHENTVAFELHREEQNQDKHVLNERLKNIQHGLEQHMVQRLNAQDYLIETLTARLQDEHRSRQMLFELFTQQQEQIQVLRREIEHVQSQARRTEE